MLTQYKVTLIPNEDRHIEQNIGYRLYSELLSRAAVEFGEEAHRNYSPPVSQYIQVSGKGLTWTVSLIGSRAEAALADTIENGSEYRLNGFAGSLKVASIQKTGIESVEDLFSQAKGMPKTAALEFKTPTAFKSHGKYIIMPSTRLILQSLVNRWNVNMPECPVEVSDETLFEEICGGLEIKSYSLKSESYRLKGNPVPGFTGRLGFANNLSGFHGQFLNAMLIFSQYSGVGIKTALGMGGTSLIISGR